MPKYFTPTALSEKMHKTPEGFLLCIGVPITRTGELVYGEGETPLETNEEGKIIITRGEDDVFNVYTVASFEGKPVTINHPNEFVSPGNWSYLAKGHMQNIRRGDGEMKDRLLADLLITDKTAIALIENGLREVSCGYEAEYIQTEEGKGRQRRIVGNHLALVDNGRAGETCAIMDHKGKGLTMSKLAEKFKAILGKAVDEAVKGEESKDETNSTENTTTPVESKAGDKAAYDELKKMFDAMGEKLNAMMGGEKSKDEDESEGEKKPAKKEKEEKKADDAEEGEAEKSMEERMKILEAAVGKITELLAKKSGAGDEDEESDEDESESESEDSDEDEDESEDDDFEESSLTGDSDTLSRAEVLSPGIEKSKDMKVKALKAAYATKEGKLILNALNGGKAPAFDSAEKVDMLFIAASEVLKNKRSGELSETRKQRVFDSDDNGSTVMTAEKMNEINAKRYGLQN